MYEQPEMKFIFIDDIIMTSSDGKLESSPDDPDNGENFGSWI